MTERSSQGTVLIVEDEAHSAAVKKIYFEQAGFKAKIATNLLDAIKLIQKTERIDCVVTDLILDPTRPMDIGGIGVAKIIKMTRPGTPIVGYSAHLVAEGVPDRDVFDAFFDKKSADQPDLEETVRGLIDRNDTLNNSRAQNSRTFLCHNSDDKPLVKRLARKLQNKGVDVWLDEWDLAPGQPWQEALEEVISEMCCALILVGDAGIGPWANRELRAFLEEFVRRGIPIIPVILPNTTSVPELPVFLKQFTWVDMRKGLRATGMERLVWGITGKKPK